MSASSQPAGTGASWDAERFHRPGYQPGIPATIEVPDSHLSELLETAARFYPDLDHHLPRAAGRLRARRPAPG